MAGMDEQVFADTPELKQIYDQRWYQLVELMARKHVSTSAMSELLKDTIAQVHEVTKKQLAEEHRLVTDTMQRVADARQEQVASTAIASIMEHLGLKELSLNLDRLATVWRNVSLSMHLDGDRRSIVFQLECREDKNEA